MNDDDLVRLSGFSIAICVRYPENIRMLYHYEKIEFLSRSHVLFIEGGLTFDFASDNCQLNSDNNADLSVAKPLTITKPPPYRPKNPQLALSQRLENVTSAPIP